MKLEIVFKDGRKETFESVASFSVTEEPAVNQGTNAIEVRPEVNKPSAREVAQTPTEGKLFEINPFGMDRSHFKKERGNQRQEWTRQIINEAFAEIDKCPQKYAEPFYTLIPEKTWDDYKTVDELKQYAKDLGGQMADWIQQALEWAQCICNGKTWEDVANNADTAKWYRMIIWKNGLCRLVGGSRDNDGNNPASYVYHDDCFSGDIFNFTVPLVALKKQH